MRSSNSLDIRIAKAAVIEAISAAEWDRIDLQTRRPRSASEELMLAKAAELAMSPVARDQLMSLALEQRSRLVSAEPSLIDVDCCVRERSLITDRILTLGPHRASDTNAVVQEIEERHAKRLRQDARFDLLAECLRQDAVLQEAFWNHPDIPATDAVRLTMLCSIPKLRDRAELLSSSACAWWSPFGRWFPVLPERMK